MTLRIRLAAATAAAALTALAVAGCSTSTSGTPVGLSSLQSSGSPTPPASSPTGTGSTMTGPTQVSDPYQQPESAAAKAIDGVTYRAEPNHNHVEGVITYDTTPPTGGDHSQFWADCAGTVYPSAIANENAVHMLEHGAVWITYNPKTLPAAQLTTLKTLVDGHDRLALSPYPELETPVSLQSWGYQLFVDNANDPRIAQFISALRYNQETTPEYGATCSQPAFLQHPSTFGHPLWVPAR